MPCWPLPKCRQEQWGLRLTRATTNFSKPQAELHLTCAMKGVTAELNGLDTTDMHCPQAAPPWYRSEATTT